MHRVLILLAFGIAACATRQAVQCEQDSNCDLAAGGMCMSLPSGDQWCAYSDPSCPSGMRFSSQEVGDGVSGECTQPVLSDASADAFQAADGVIVDAMIDAEITDAKPDAAVAPIVTNDQLAAFVLGQPSFATADSDHGGVSAQSLSQPQGIAISDNGSLWVCDTSNARALQWSTAPDTTFAAASHVIGQGTFTGSNEGSATANTISNGGCGIAAEGNKIVVLDGSRDRVLIFNQPSSNGPAAVLVLGQPNFTTTGYSGTSATTVNGPNAAWTDGTRLVVSDSSNQRVLIWKTFPTQNQQPADLVLGHSDFTTEFSPTPPTASSLSSPGQVYFDGTRLFVADNGNNRVLIWNSFPTTNGQPADIVLGQADFSTRTGGLGRNVLNAPTGLAVAGNSLFVVDKLNNRVLVFSPIPTSSNVDASYVLGQPDFLSSGQGSGQAGFFVPLEATTIGHTLYITDSFNNRVMGFALDF